MYLSTKTYGHEVGLSCCFRQWRAESHCKLLHGYALSVKLEFAAETLDKRNWVVDFGGLAAIKLWLQHMFDHTMLVATDDPMLFELVRLSEIGLARVHVIHAVGCEAFAQVIAARTEWWLSDNGYMPRVRLASVEVREHGANSAIYRPSPIVTPIDATPDQIRMDLEGGA